MTKEEIKQVLEMASQIAYDWAINDLKPEKGVTINEALSQVIFRKLTEEKGGER